MLPEWSQRELEGVHLNTGEVKAIRVWWPRMLSGAMTHHPPSGAPLQTILALEMVLQVVLLESVVAQVGLIGQVSTVKVHVVLEVLLCRKLAGQCGHE